MNMVHSGLKASVPTEQDEKMTSQSLTDVFAELREAMRPVFEDQRETWEREGPAAMARASILGIVIDNKGGNCPVQAEGSFGDRRFYFRARGDAWSLSVWSEAASYLEAKKPDEWFLERDYGDGFDAGWMPLHEAVGFICDAVEAYQATGTASAPAMGTEPSSGEVNQARSALTGSAQG